MLYLWLATIFGYTSPDTALSGATISNNFFKIGGFGNSFANFNRGMFGYISFVYLPLLLLPIYRLHDNTNYSFRKIQLTFAYLLLFVGVLMLQSLIFHSGQFGNYLHSLLIPYIGLFGVTILTFIVIIVALLLIVERTATFLLRYFWGTLQMTLQSFNTLLEKTFEKIRDKYIDLKLDYIQRSHKKMINQELSQRETTTRNKFLYDEPLIETPLDEYKRPTKNNFLDDTNTNAQIPQKDVSSDKQNKTQTQQDSKDSFNIQVLQNPTQTQGTLSYQQYNDSDINTISHTPRTQIQNGEEDLLRRFQKTNPYPKYNQNPHAFIDEPMTFRIKSENSEPKLFDSFVRTQQAKLLTDDWWLSDKTLQREAKTTNFIKPKAKDSIQTIKNTAESFTIKEVDTLDNVESLLKDFAVDKPVIEQDLEQKATIKVKQAPDFKQSLNAETQNHKTTQLQKQTNIHIHNKIDTQQMPLNASYKTLDMGFTQEDSSQDSRQFYKQDINLEQKDSNNKDLIYPSVKGMQDIQNLALEKIQIEDTANQNTEAHNDIYNTKEALEQTKKHVSIESNQENSKVIQDTFTEELVKEGKDFIVVSLDSMELANNKKDDAIESVLVAQTSNTIHNDTIITNFDNTKELLQYTKQDNNINAKDTNISNNTLKEAIDFDIKEIKEQTIPTQEIITIKQPQHKEDKTHKQDSIKQNYIEKDQEMQNTKSTNNLCDIESNKLHNSTQLAQDNKISLQGNFKSKELSNQKEQNIQSMSNLNTTTQQDSIISQYITSNPHTITQSNYIQSPINTNLHYPNSIQAQSYDFNIKTQNATDYSNRANTISYNMQNLDEKEAIAASIYSKDSKQSQDSNQLKITESNQSNQIENAFKEQNSFQETNLNQSTNIQDLIIKQIAQKKEEEKQGDITLSSHDENIVKLTQNEQLPFILPPLKLLQEPIEQDSIQDFELDSKIEKMLQIFNAHKIRGDIIDTLTGPVVTTFEFRPETHVKVSKILSHRNDLARILKAKSIRIQAPIPGKDVIGIQIPNSKVETIYLREILQSSAFLESQDMLTIALGKDISGMPIVANLAKLPHLLIAGTTGSGKSVGVNAIILSLLYRNDPDSLKLMMIDPKQVEFAPYEDLPHLITPIINAPNKAIKALQVATVEMDKRYELFSQIKVKNIASYNEKSSIKMPNFVIIIDELADLMITGGKEAEAFIARIAQMGRAAGMHLIIATQRSSVNVITGHIKANLPSRISYRVGSRIDSKVILDEMGAEDLLGNGDGLFTTTNGLMRIHAPWVSEQEVEHIVDFIKAQRKPQYDDAFLNETNSSVGDKFSGDGSLIDRAKQIILQDNKTSISYLQRKLGIGYNKSASLIEALEQEGFLSAPNSKGERSIL